MSEVLIECGTHMATAALMMLAVFLTEYKK